MITLGSLVNRILPTGSEPSASSATDGTERILDQSLADGTERILDQSLVDASPDSIVGTERILDQSLAEATSRPNVGTERILDQSLAEASSYPNVGVGGQQTGTFESVSVIEASVVVEADETGALETRSAIEASVVTEETDPLTMVTTRAAQAKPRDGERRLKRRRGMEKMITVGTRVSGKCGKLIPNPRGSQFRRVRERTFGNVISSIGNNKYKVRFDDGSTKDVSSTSLQIEESTVGLPPSETVATFPPPDPSTTNTKTIADSTTAATPTGSEAVEEIEEHVQDSQDQIDDEEHIPTNGDEDGISGVVEDGNDEINDEAVNIGDINIPADVGGTTESDAPLTYQDKLQRKRQSIRQLLGQTITKKQKNLTMKWKVIEESTPQRSALVSEFRDNLSNRLGLSRLTEFLNQFGYEEDTSRDSCSYTSSNCNMKVQSLQESTIFAELFLKLMYKDWDEKLIKMNRYIEEHNAKNPKRTIKKFERWDFVIGHALLIGASCYCQSGSMLFNDSKDSGDNTWDTIIPNAHFNRYMKLYRFKEFRHFLPKVFELPLEKDHDPWWPIASAIDDFNDIRKNNVESSWIKVLDESMSAWRPRTSKNGGLPNISYIIRKPEPLGTEFKTVCCPVTGVMTYMEIQRGKSGMSTQPYHKDLGATAACTIRAGEATNVHQEARTILMGDAWFGSVKAASVASKRKMEAVYQIKSNHGLYPKQFIEDALKDGPGGTHIVLEGKHPDGAELIAIGYRYNSKVTLCFVMTKNVGSTKPGTPYEMKFTDLHGNVHVRLVDRPAVISNFFQASNCVDKHNQARQYELALEKMGYKRSLVSYHYNIDRSERS